MGGCYIFMGSNLEKYGQFCIWPDWGNAAWADIAGLGSIGFRPFLVILPNLTYFGHDSSYFFNDYRRTKHHPMIKQTVPESSDCQEKVDVTNSTIG